MKDHIEEVAVEEFLKYGFKNYTMDDLSKKLSMSKKTLYEYYSSKSDLVKACMEKIILTAQKIDIPSKGENVIEAYFNAQKEFLDKYKITNSKMFWELRKYYPEVFQYIDEKYCKNDEQNAEKMILLGIEQGVFRENLNIKFLKKLLVKIMKNKQEDEDFFLDDNFSMAELMSNFLEAAFRILVNEKGAAVLENILKEREKNEK